MIYKEYDYDSLAHLPEDVNCFIEGSHSAKKDKEITYLGGSVGTTINPTVNMELFTKTDTQAQEFFDWYNDTIQKGTTPFTALHEIFGREEYYVLEIIDGIEEKIIGGNNRKIKFTADIIGISYPDYIVYGDGEVLTDGTIKILLSPSGPDEEYIIDKFSLDLNGVTCGVISAVRTADVLYIEADRTITEYPTATLSHTEKEMGLVVFEQELTNNSTVTRATVSENAIVSSDGTTIIVPLDKSTYEYIWENAEDFIIKADGETISLSTNPLSYPATGANSILLYFDESRPVYKYEEVNIWFNDNEHIEISSFSNISATNNSILVSPETNEILSANINSSGLLTLADMSIPQDRTYDSLKTTLSLNEVSYTIDSIEQHAGTLIIENGFPITSYVTSASLIHNAQEWGFGTANFALTNNSTVARASVNSASVAQNGETITVLLDREVGLTHLWSTDEFFTITADGIELDMYKSFVSYSNISKNRNIWYFYISRLRPIYEGETILISYSETDNIEISHFTDESCTNNSVIPEPMQISSALVETTGDMITCTMSQSDSVTYNADYFLINYGYLEQTPT